MWRPESSSDPRRSSAAAERLLQRNHGYRYYTWDIHQGSFRYVENAKGLEREKGIEGKYVIATGESGLSVLEVVAIYKDLSDVERGFRQLKDVLAMRPIYHQIETRVKAHILWPPCRSWCSGFWLAGSKRRDRLLGGSGNGGVGDGTLRRFVWTIDLERRGVSGGCPDGAPGPEGVKAD